MKKRITISLDKLEDYIVNKKAYIANYDFLTNKGILNNGTYFILEDLENISANRLRDFLNKNGPRRNFETIKDAIINAIQSFKAKENNRINEIIETIVKTDEELLDIEFVIKNFSLENSGVKMFAERIYKDTARVFKDSGTSLLNKTFYQEYLAPESDEKYKHFIKILEDLQIIDSSVDDEVGLVFIDLDNLKAINDNINHIAGDRALEVFSNMLLELDIPSLPIRMGGDEFIILCSKDNAHKVKEILDSDSFNVELYERLSAHMRDSDMDILKKYKFKATCAISSFSISSKNEIKTNFETAFKEADSKVSRIKASREEPFKYRNKLK